MEFQELAYIFVKQIGIPSIFLFRGMVRNGIPRVCLYFCSTVHNYEHFPLPRNGSEWNSESFLFCGTAGIPQEQTNSFVYPIRFFLSKMANPAVALDQNCRQPSGFVPISLSSFLPQVLFSLFPQCGLPWKPAARLYAGSRLRLTKLPPLCQTPTHRRIY